MCPCFVVPPEIDAAPSAYQVVEGSGAILFCNATGNPQPNITWTKQGNNSKLSASETLNLTNLMREDDGSLYKCTVTNYIGSTDATATVTVFCKSLRWLTTVFTRQERALRFGFLTSISLALAKLSRATLKETKTSLSPLFES